MGGLASRELQGAVITTQFTDLPDAVPGQDLWQGSYALSGMSFAAGQGFTLYYAYSQYRDLASVTPPGHPGWDLLVIQPDLGLPDDGFFDGLALVSNPDLSNPFVVTFVWLGGSGGPGQQPFEIYDLAGGFNVIGSGTTVPVPEPALGALAVGFALFAGAAIRRSRSESPAEISPGSPPGRRAADPLGRASA